MKVSLTVALFIGVNVMLLFLQIHKTSMLVAQSYRKQKNEHILDELAKQKQSLTQQLFSAKNHAAIKSYASKNLGMEPVRLSQIKTYTL